MPVSQKDNGIYESRLRELTNELAEYKKEVAADKSPEELKVYADIAVKEDGVKAMAELEASEKK